MEYDRKYLLLRLLLFVSPGGNSCVWRTAGRVLSLKPVSYTHLVAPIIRRIQVYRGSACFSVCIKLYCHTCRSDSVLVAAVIPYLPYTYACFFRCIGVRQGGYRLSLIHIFRTSTGRSPQEFLIHYRMTKAAELLKLTTLSIGDIGSAVGYENALHFSRAFKNVYGVSPRAWREQHR